MPKIKELLDHAIKKLKPEYKGRVPESVYHFLRRYSPMLCADIVLVPRGKKPSVILFKRDRGSVAPDTYSVTGGRLMKQKNIFASIKLRLKEETGLTIPVSHKDIIGLGLPSYTPNQKEKIQRDYTVFTPTFLFLARISSTQVSKINTGSGNLGWRKFRSIEQTWDYYAIHAVARAWDVCYGKAWRKNIDKKFLRMLDDYTELIPVRFDP